MYLLLCAKFFPDKGNVVWSANKLIIIQIGEMIRDLSDKFGETMWGYFKYFQSRMHQRERIPTGIVQKFKETIYFLVDTNCCIVQAVQPRTFWVPAMGYDIGVDPTKIYVNMLLSKSVDKNAKRFGTFQEASSKIKRELKEPIIQKKVRKMIDTLDKKYGGETFGATTSTRTSEQMGAKSRKDIEQKKMSKTKPKGATSNKLTTYMKEKDLDTPTFSQGKGKSVGVTYVRKKRNERIFDTHAKKNPKKDEKEGDKSNTQSDIIVKEVRRSGRNVAPIVDELVHRIKECGGLASVGRKYPLCNEEDKIKIEDSLIWKLHNFYRTPSELDGIIPSDLQNLIEGRWKTSLAIEKEHKIKALMELQYELDYDQASIMV